jgi:hypothetical protein
MNMVTLIEALASHGLKQKPEVPLIIRQEQVPLQCMVALQLPGQKLAKLVAFLSCRAETVPAERMVAKMVANSVILAIFLTMCKSSFQLKSRMMPRLGVRAIFSAV